MILSDEEITRLCTAPLTYFDKEMYNLHIRRHGIVAPAIEGGAEMADAALRKQYTRATTEDERAAFKPMISPFNGALVREVLGPAGFGIDQTLPARKIVSKGLTSYGYDVSLADEFKLFTNVNSAIIDPKRLDEKCLVDAKVQTDEEGARYVILPPNSYLLGRTVEYFRMPRDVLAVCLGKCLAGDTLITDASTGAIRRMDQCIAEMSVTALNVETGKLEEHRTEGLIANGTLPLMEIRTKSGHRIKATPTHPFRTWNQWTPASDLKVGSRIAVARSEPFVGTGELPLHEARLLGFMTADGQCYAPGGSPSFTKHEEVVKQRFISDAEAMGFICREGSPGVVRLVNKVGKGGNASENRASTWLDSLQMKVKSVDKHIPEVVQCANKEALREYLKALFTCDGSFQLAGPKRDRPVLEYYTIADKLAEELRIILRRFGLFFTHKRQFKTFNGQKHHLHILRTTNLDTIHRFAEQIGMIEGSVKDQKLRSWVSLGWRSVKSNFDTLPPEAWPDLLKILERHQRKPSDLGIDVNFRQSVSLTALESRLLEIEDAELTAMLESDVIWDTVDEITHLEAGPVFDFSVPGPRNFLANGLVVHNSTYARAGAIVNVTPIEPGFEGHVVIEISNSTNLPMKIYADEGISQFLFLRGKPCLVSYADRGGKYQGQTGITLPKV